MTDAPGGSESIRAQIAAQLAIAPDLIDDNADLIQLGLDSIRMMRLAGTWRKAGFNVNFAELAAAPTVGEWARMLTTAATEEPAVSVPASRHADENFPLAPMQHAYWVGRGDGPELGGVAAHLYVEFDSVTVNPARLRAAVHQLASIHPMLRVQFNADGTQRVLAEPHPEIFTVHDLRDQGAADITDSLAHLRETKSHQRLDVHDGRVLDVTLTLLPDNSARLHVDVDMLAADAMSYRLLLADLAALYRGSRLSPAAFEFRDYLSAAPANSPVYERDRAWWQQRLPELPAAPELPLIPESQRRQPHRVERLHHWFDPAAAERLRTGAHGRGVTPAMALAAVFAETIGRWSAQPQFLLNVPLFHRQSMHPDIDRVVGDFTSSVLLDVDVAAPATVVERARALQETMHRNASHGSYGGLEVLRDLARLRGEPVLAPIVYTSALNLGELFATEVRETFGTPVWIVSQGPQVLLDAQVTELDGGLLVNWDVRAEAFPAGVVQTMFDQYVSAIVRLCEGEAGWTAESRPQLPIDQRTVRSAVNDTSGPLPKQTLHQGFFEHAAKVPDAPALIWGQANVLSYGDVAARALAVAGALLGEGVRNGQNVVIHLPKGPEQVIAALGVLATGATYVPVAVDQPAARRRQIIDTSDAVLVISRSDVPGTHTLIYETALGKPPLAQPLYSDPEDAAYILFTSGSTGTPKGVVVPHRAAMNTICDLVDRFGIGPGDRSLAVSAFEFDLSVFDIFALLHAGGAVVTVTDDERGDAQCWSESIRRHAVRVLNCVPSVLDMLLNVGGLGDSLRAVLLGGDWVGVDLPLRLSHQVPGARFAGLGGATETAIHSTICEISDPPAHWPAVPYGTPLRNVLCRVVDGFGADCPDWVCGELWIGGAGVARGYHNDPERSAAQFVTYNGERWYRTGDLARYWPDGTLEFLGRADHRVKIRGHRIELGEVEAALRSVTGVHLAVAVAISNSAPTLAAVVAREPTSESLTGQEIRSQLASLLPAYMVPNTIVVVAALPLSANGKLDRKAAAQLAQRELAGVDGSDAAPDSALERALIDIIGGVLGVEVGVEDDFFALGGDSVMATAVVARIREWLDAPNAVVADLFTARTVRALAPRLDSADAVAGRLEQVAQVYLEVSAMDESELAALAVGR
ncbi:amino acid adenylation domain-containing protein [Skermania sp. ID1734]|uniref:non-ribosomal peptide synthetase n=1 Tax=Skermania sp. ID1734 TaxID=2597516 RepID=UPI00118008DB|nr:non-ribosomal peptide synthetase [Skermania sp. ID1734]TSE01423.1 amino acid adenylation domain-containing protein [Skermania sp. ID1734]